eukprot:tig00000292_g23856.t1
MLLQSKRGTILDVLQLSVKFGERFKRLHLGRVRFDVGVERIKDRLNCLVDILEHCPNLTHLSLAGANLKPIIDAFAHGPESFWPLAGLENLPNGFSLPRLCHLDLSGLQSLCLQKSPCADQNRFAHSSNPFPLGATYRGAAANAAATGRLAMERKCLLLHLRQLRLRLQLHHRYQLRRLLRLRRR